jgi:uncharacterized protein YndB with AHSA1/START domain
MKTPTVHPTTDLIFERTTTLTPAQLWQGWTDPDTVRRVAVVVARVEVPKITNGPVEVEPVVLDRKLRFSTHPEPFQNRVEPVAEPSFSTLGILYQYVE